MFDRDAAVTVPPVDVPSEFSVSPVELGAPTDVTPWLTDAGFSLTCGWRF